MSRRDVEKLFDLSDAEPEGAPGVAPCGHAGVHVLPGYVQCVEGCDHYGVRVNAPLARPDRETKCLHKGNVGSFYRRGKLVRFCLDCEEEC